MTFDDFLDQMDADPEVEVQRLKYKFNMFRESVQQIADEELDNEHLNLLLCDQRFEEET